VNVIRRLLALRALRTRCSCDMVLPTFDPSRRRALPWRQRLALQRQTALWLAPTAFCLCAHRCCLTAGLGGDREPRECGAVQGRSFLRGEVGDRTGLFASGPTAASIASPNGLTSPPSVGARWESDRLPGSGRRPSAGASRCYGGELRGAFAPEVLDSELSRMGRRSQWSPRSRHTGSASQLDG
jgi:hypothetical protein